MGRTFGNRFSGKARSRVRLHPTGGQNYTVTVDGVTVARAFFARYRTGNGVRAEAWVEHVDGRITEMVTAYFSDFVRRVRAIFDPQTE